VLDESATGTFYNWRAVLQARMAAQQRNLHPSLRYLLEVVAGFTNGHPAFPSYAALARITGLSATRVRHQIQALVDQGYLTQGRRRPTVAGGWGQPEWSLATTCQVEVVAHSHLQVVTHDQSSGHTRPLASGHRRPQKRDSVDHADSVVPEETPEEKDPPTPQPAVRAAPKPQPEAVAVKGNPRVAAFIDGLRAGGGKCELEGTLTGQDFKFIKDGDFDAGDLGACYRATADGAWAGADPWIKARLSLANVHRYRYPRWVTRHAPAAPADDAEPGGRVGAMRSFLDSFKEVPPDDTRPVLRALPAPRPALRAT